VRARGLLLEDELRELVRTAGVARVDPVLRYLGWDGRGGSTLQVAADEAGITRERVRQLAAKVADRLGPHTFAPVLDRAVACFSTPLRPLEQVERTLLASGITGSSFRAEGVIRAAELLRGPVSLRVAELDGDRVLVDERTERAIHTIRRLADKACRRWTVMSLLDLEAQYRERGGRVDLDLRRVVERVPGFSWLDEASGWFWIHKRRSRLLNQIRKILAVAGKIALGELRAGIARHHRMQGFAPPKHVLAALCCAVGYRVEGETVIADPPLDWVEVLADVEKTMVGVLQEAGGVMGRDEFERRCVAADMNRNTFYQYLSYSPIVARYAPGVYGLRGIEVQPGVVEGLRRAPRRGDVLQDYGWTGDAKIWLGYRLSENTVASGVVSIPANMRRFVDGEYVLEGEGGERLGRLRCRESSAWGLGPLIARRGLEAGDFLMLTLDQRAHVARVGYGTEAPWEDEHGDGSRPLMLK